MGEERESHSPCPPRFAYTGTLKISKTLAEDKSTKKNKIVFRLSLLPLYWVKELISLCKKNGLVIPPVHEGTQGGRKPFFFSLALPSSGSSGIRFR